MERRELEKIRRLSEAIVTHTARVEEVRASAIGAHCMDTVGGSKAAPVNKIEKICLEIVTEEAKLDAIIDKRRELIDQAYAEIMQKVDDRKQRHILYLRYIATNKQGHCLEWDDIIQIVHRVHNIQRSRIYELHHIAVKKLR